MEADRVTTEPDFTTMDCGANYVDQFARQSPTVGTIMHAARSDQERLDWWAGVFSRLAAFCSFTIGHELTARLLRQTAITTIQHARTGGWNAKVTR